jgi:hypothetical protein
MRSAREVLPRRSIETMSSALASSRLDVIVWARRPASGSTEPETGGGGAKAASLFGAKVSVLVLLQAVEG